MPLGASRAGMLGAAGSSGAGGFLAWGGQVVDWVSSVSPYTGPMRAHIFYGPAKFRVTSEDKDIHYCVVAGGGSSAQASSTNSGSGGGGGGGCRTSFHNGSASSPMVNVSSTGGPSSDGVYPVYVGAGGVQSQYGTMQWNWPTGNWYETADDPLGPMYIASFVPESSPGAGDQILYTGPGPNGSETAGNGQPSLFNGISAIGGGTGGGTNGAGKPGGNGGGGSGGSAVSGGDRFTFGQSPDYSPVQGNAGGAGTGPTGSGWWRPFGHGSGGGGGFSGAGGGATYGGGPGGAGVIFPLGGSDSWRLAGGGGGGGQNSGSPNGNEGYAQSGYGGAPGSKYTATGYNCTKGAMNSGGGAGGGHNGSATSGYNWHASGGSGIVILSYLKD
jgi:hypothetical protein